MPLIVPISNLREGVLWLCAGHTLINADWKRHHCL